MEWGCKAIKYLDAYPHSLILLDSVFHKAWSHSSQTNYQHLVHSMPRIINVALKTKSNVT